MRPNRLLLLITLFTALTVASAIPGRCMGVKYKTAGVFTDSVGGQHAWNIDANHTLFWDGEPYVPVGGTFASKCISAGAADENYQADVKALEDMKAKGITDIVLTGSAPITSTDPAAWQKIISYLDSNGFTYGIEINDGPKDILKGYVITPNAFKIEGPYPETNISCNISGVDSAIYVVMKRTDSAVKATGGAVVKDGKVSVRLSEPLASGDLLFVYPRKVFGSAAEGGVSDVWSGFGEYRDRVMEFFKAIKFGKGLRFFLEPLSSKIDFTGDMGNFVPDSAAFRLGFEAYLTKKYVHEGGINSEWGLSEYLNSVEQAARLIPLWISGRGAPYFYDKTNAKLSAVDPSATKYWTDLIDYRDTSAQGFLNTIADTLKKQVANVPVILRCTNYHRIYATPFGIGGFDGLIAPTTGTSESIVAASAGPVYSLTEECGKTMWYAAGVRTAGYDNEKTMTGSLDLLREIGCKGFFADNLFDSPTRIDWMGKFKAEIKPASMAEFKPDVVFFPSVPPTGAHTKRLAPNAWWLPSLMLGKSTYIGDGLFAYTIAGEDRSYLWSSIGDVALTFRNPPTGVPNMEYPKGGKISSGRKGGKFAITLTANPIVLHGADVTLLFPFETANLELSRLAELIPVADKAGIDVKQARALIDRAKTVLANGQYYIAYGMSQSAIQNILSQMGGDLWVEAEQSNLSNLGSLAAVPGASEGEALVLDTSDDPPLSPYTAYFRLNTSANSSYEIWLAATPFAQSSPISYCVDDGAWTSVTSAEGKSEAYAPGLSWYKIGAVNLFPGNHTLKIRVTGKRSQDNRYYFTLDAAVLSPKGFKPDGVKKPY